MFNPAGRRRRRAVPCRDSGVTFIEILVTIVLLGTIVIAVLAATRTSISASATSRAAADAESRVIAVADDIARAEQTCGEFVPAVQQHIVRVDHLDYDGGDGPTGWHEGEACHDGALTPNLVQRYTLRVTSGDGSVVRTLQVVKGVPIEPAPIAAEGG